MFAPANCPSTVMLSALLCDSSGLVLLCVHGESRATAWVFQSRLVVPRQRTLLAFSGTSKLWVRIQFLLQLCLQLPLRLVLR